MARRPDMSPLAATWHQVWHSHAEHRVWQAMHQDGRPALAGHCPAAVMSAEGSSKAAASSGNSRFTASSISDAITACPSRVK